MPAAYFASDEAKARIACSRAGLIQEAHLHLAPAQERTLVGLALTIGLLRLELVFCRAGGLGPGRRL